MISSPKLRLLGFVVAALGLALGASAVNGEIANRSGTAPVQTAQNAAARLAADTPLRVECWQEGKRIINEDKLYGFSVSSLLNNASLSFRQVPGGDVNVFVLSLKHSTCLIRDASAGGGT